MLFITVVLLVVSSTITAGALGFFFGGWPGAFIAGAVVPAVAVIWRLLAALVERINWKRECRAAMRLDGTVIDTSWFDLLGREQQGSVDLATVCAMDYSIGADGECVIVHFYRLHRPSERKTHAGWFPAERLLHSDPIVYSAVRNLANTGEITPGNDVLNVLQEVMLKEKTVERVKGR